MLQDGLHGFNSLRFSDTLFQDNRFKLLNDLTILHDLLHETWLHHLSVVGNSIVEGYSVNWCNLRLVANAHPRESRLTPVFRTVSGLGVRHSNHRRMIADNRNLQILVNADSVESLNIFAWVAAIELVNDIAYANI